MGAVRSVATDPSVVSGTVVGGEVISGEVDATDIEVDTIDVDVEVGVAASPEQAPVNRAKAANAVNRRTFIVHLSTAICRRAEIIVRPPPRSG